MILETQGRFIFNYDKIDELDRDDSCSNKTCGNGVCLGGQCHCFKDYKGDNCSDLID